MLTHDVERLNTFARSIKEHYNRDDSMKAKMLKSFPCYGRSSTNLILTDTDISHLGGNKVSYKQSWRALKATRAHQCSEWRDPDRYATPEPVLRAPRSPTPRPECFSTPISGCSKGADLQPPEGLGPDELEDWELKNLPCKELLRRLEKNLTCREMLRRAVVTEAREKERRAPVKPTTHAWEQWKKLMNRMTWREFRNTVYPYD
jgi:hypothetical protein